MNLLISRLIFAESYFLAKLFSSIENFYRKHLTSKALCDIILKQCGYGGIGRRAWFRLRYVSVKNNFALLISISVEQLVISPPRSGVVPCKIFRLNYISGYGGIGRRAWFRLRYVSVKNNFALLISISVEQLVISPPRSGVVPCKIFRLNYISGYGGIGRRAWFRSM